jgi:hypothetical protein
MRPTRYAPTLIYRRPEFHAVRRAITSEVRMAVVALGVVVAGAMITGKRPAMGLTR